MDISHCDELRALPYDLGSLQSLETLQIYHCRNLQSISYQNGQEGLSSLLSLGIHDCYELSNLPNEMLECSKSLQRISVHECPNLTMLPEMRGMGSLESLIVFRCHELTSLPELSGMELQELIVLECDNLTSLPEMSGMESLQILIVAGCDNLTSFPKFSGIGCLNSLIKLTIGGFSNSVQFNSFQDFLDDIEHIKSLEKLQLMCQADWVSLPYQLQHLTSLKELEIFDFGMEALPDWFGNLSSLEKLRLQRCEKLRHLPSKEAMQQLTKLKQLNIGACPLLEERCKAESGPDSEWPKISHIPRVDIEDL